MRLANPELGSQKLMSPILPTAAIWPSFLTFRLKKVWMYLGKPRVFLLFYHQSVLVRTTIYERVNVGVGKVLLGARNALFVLVRGSYLINLLRGFCVLNFEFLGQLDVVLRNQLIPRCFLVFIGTIFEELTLST